MMIEFRENRIERDGIEFHAQIGQLENAVIVFLYEATERLGTIAFAMPGTGELQAGRSSVLVGAKYMVAARALAERGAAKFKKMCLVSLHTSLDEPEAFRVFAKLLDGDIRPKDEASTKSQQ